MSEMLNLKELERLAFRRTFQDGYMTSIWEACLPALLRLLLPFSLAPNKIGWQLCFTIWWELV